MGNMYNDVAFDRSYLEDSPKHVQVKMTGIDKHGRTGYIWVSVIKEVWDQAVTDKFNRDAEYRKTGR